MRKRSGVVFDCLLSLRGVASVESDLLAASSMVPTTKEQPRKGRERKEERR